MGNRITRPEQLPVFRKYAERLASSEREIHFLEAQLGRKATGCIVTILHRRRRWQFTREIRRRPHSPVGIRMALYRETAGLRTHPRINGTFYPKSPDHWNWE